MTDDTTLLLLAAAATGGLLGMVKRGGDFNPDNGGWEWFMLANDLSGIAAQGADLMSFEVVEHVVKGA